MPRNAARTPKGVERSEVVIATRILGSVVGVDLVRFMATREDVAVGFYWRDVADALPQHPESNVRRQLAAMEDAGVVRVDVPINAPRGKRRGAPVKFYYRPERLDQLLTAAREWVTGGPATPEHEVGPNVPAAAEQ